MKVTAVVIVEAATVSMQTESTVEVTVEATIIANMEVTIKSVATSAENVVKPTIRIS